MLFFFHLNIKTLYDIFFNRGHPHFHYQVIEIQSYRKFQTTKETLEEARSQQKLEMAQIETDTGYILDQKQNIA